MPLSADRVVLTSGTSEGIELALTALAEAGDEVLVPVPTYPLYTAVLAKIGARAVFYRTDAARGWLPDLDHIRSLITPATRALVAIDPNNPTGAVYPPDVRRALVDLAEEHGIPLLADEVYADLAFDGPVERDRRAQSRCAGHHVLVAVEGVSGARLARGLDGGRPDRAAGRRAGGGEEAGGRPAVRDGTDGVRDHGRAQRRSLAPGGVSSRAARARGADDVALAERSRGSRSCAPAAAFYAMPKVALPPGVTDEDYVLGLLRATGRALRVRIRVRHQAG